MTNKTTVLELRQRLQHAFDALASGQFDAARQQFSQLCLEPTISVDAYRGLAAVSWRQGQVGSAVEFLKQALTIAPDHTDARADLAVVLTVSGQRIAAISEWERVLQARPEDPDVWHNYAKLLGDLRQLGPSRQAFDRSLALAPGRVPTLSAYATMLAKCDCADEAEAVWERVIALQPSAMEGFQGLAEVQFGRGHLERALATYERGVTAAPSAPEMHMGLGQLKEDFADRQGAEASFRRALELRPEWPAALEALLSLLKGDAEATLIQTAQRIVGDAAKPAADRANVGFGLGKALDATGRYEEAFNAWRSANQARRAHIGPYDRAATSQRVDRLVSTFSTALFERLGGLGNLDERPVFVVGMPRSGTSLVEQIISAHPSAAGFGELVDVHRIATSLPQRLGSIQRWPEVAASLGAEALVACGAEYLSTLGRRGDVKVDRCVDKAPLNFFYVGFIAAVFPNAKIIWCQRDPRDVCLSIYGENFSLDQKFATDLGDLARYYADYMRLMRHWQSVLPGRIYGCVYEDLVADPERRARELIHAVDLPWDERCLKFYESDRPVLTPSRWQVRQPMYAKAKGRWRNYEPWLGPLLQGLGDEGRV